MDLTRLNELLIIILTISFSCQVIADKNKTLTDCDEYVCIRKCCQIGYAMMDNNCTPSSTSLNSYRQFAFTFGHQCPEQYSAILPYSEEFFRILPDGKMDLYVTNTTTLTIDVFEYCIDYIGNYSFISVITCIKGEEELSLIVHYGKR